MSKRAEATLVVLGFACLAIVSTSPLVLRIVNHLPSDLGDPLLSAWTLAWDAQRLRHGLARIWDAPSFYPYPHTLLYSDHLLGIAIFTSPIQWLTENAVLVYNVAFIASYVLSGVGMYVLVRELTGRRDAAAIAGVIYACQPFRALHLSHLQWLMTGWLPLSLWALHRYFATRRLRDLLLATIFYLLQSLTAAYFTYFALVPLVVVFAIELWSTRLPLPLLAKHLAPVVLLTACVLGPTARAYYELRQHSGLKRSADEIRKQSADVAGYFSPPPNVWLWSGRSPIRGEREVFPGAIAILLALAAIGSRFRPRVVSLYALVLVVGLVLSLGPEPMAWNHSLHVPGPYGLLLRVVPGLDGLRVPARLAVVVQIALAVIASIGYVRIADRLSPPTRIVVLAVAIAAIFAEGWTGPIVTPAFGPNGVDYEQDAYAWLRRLPSGPVMELPTSIEDPSPEFKYQYMTLVHRHPVVNGHSGYVSPLVTWLGGGHSPLRESDAQRDALEIFRGLGVRYLVVHRGSYADESLADAMLAALKSAGAPVVEQRAFGTITVAVLTPLELPAPPENVARVPTASIHAQASHSNGRVPLMFDGDLDTRWISSGHQSGDEEIDLELDRPRDVRVVRLQLGTRSFGDYPRDLSIEAIEDGGSRTLFRGTVLPQLARGIVASADYPFIEVVLPPNHARALRLRQLGRTRVFFWSVHELQLLERL